MSNTRILIHNFYIFISIEYICLEEIKFDLLNRILELLLIM